MSGLGNLFDRPAAKWVAIAFAALTAGIAVYVVKQAFFPSFVAQERSRIFIDSQTGKSFRHEIEKGESIPVDAPSGGKTGYPAELCYWTADGQIKSDPTPVLLNSWIGKPGPTFCPDCGRLVVGNNPFPMPGSRPPPTEQEWRSRHAIGIGPELLHSVATSN